MDYRDHESSLNDESSEEEDYIEDDLSEENVTADKVDVGEMEINSATHSNSYDGSSDVDEENRGNFEKILDEERFDFDNSTSDVHIEHNEIGKGMDIIGGGRKDSLVSHSDVEEDADLFNYSIDEDDVDMLNEQINPDLGTGQVTRNYIEDLVEVSMPVVLPNDQNKHTDVEERFF